MSSVSLPQLTTLRGILLEEAIPTGAKTGTSKGIPPRDVVEHITQGELQTSCLRLGKAEKKVWNELARLDEQELNNKYKIGVLYCCKGQTTEEEMYNNEEGSPAFEEFLELLGQKVTLKGFTKYRAQLDNKTDTTGVHSVYTEFRDAEVMFHISTYLPHTPSNKQQLLRKRHIGNDIVTIIFQEPGCVPFSPRFVRSHFQHIFIVVRAENANTSFTRYRIAVSRSQDIPYFGPSIPEGAVFDKNDLFKEFLLVKLINACNASLRNEKFSAMAARTRRQYLTDLAESGANNITIEQANMSGRVGISFRRHQKKERSRQDSTLMYSPGALTWGVSLILRQGKPLPFSEEHDFFQDCTMGISPDLVVFKDLNSSATVLHIPTESLTGWLQDKSRLNLFYDDSHCLSLELYDSEEEPGEIATRLQAVAPRLSLSHEATLMEFQRSSNGLLGFGINEAGVVHKVDGLAKSSGLQTKSRLLQVEDRLLSCHSHSQIMELLLDKRKLTVKAYVVPPPPIACRELLHYPSLNWSAIWATRPSAIDSDSVKVQNGTEAMETSVELRSHSRKTSNTSNRYSYIEAMQAGDLGLTASGQPIDDDEPLYDKLRSKPGVTLRNRPRSRSPAPSAKSPVPGSGNKGIEDHLGFTRVKRTMKATRESVVQFADDLMERNIGRSQAMEPEAMDHTIDVYSHEVEAQVATSMEVPQNKPHTAAPLSLRFRRTPSGDQKPISTTAAPSIEVSTPTKSEVPGTPGQVHELAKRFSYASSPGTPTGGKTPSRIPVSSSHTPMKAMTSASEMTKSQIPVRAVSTGTPISASFMSNGPTADNGTVLENGDVQFRNGGVKRGSKMRPASWDASLIFNGEKSRPEHSKDDSVSNLEDAQSFNRNSNIRTAFRKKSSSRGELSPEPLSPTRQSDTSSTAVMLSENAMFSDENLLTESDIENELIMEMAGPPSGQKLTQGSGSSQESGEFLPVRERTKRWEARGSDLPSYFSTLPKSFRHKADDPRRSSAQHPSRETLMKLGNKGRNSLSSIPTPVRRSRNSSASSSQTPPPGAGSLPREEADGSSNPDDPLQKSGSEQHESSPSEMTVQPVIKSSRSVSVGVGRYKGQGLLPTKTQIPTSTNIPVSSQRISQPVADQSEDIRATSPTDNRSRRSASVDRCSNIPRPNISILSSFSRGPYVATSLSSSSTEHSKGAGKGSGKKSVSIVATKSPRPSVTNSSAVEHDVEIDSKLGELALTDDHREEANTSCSRAVYSPHIEDWVRHASENAVALEAISHSAENPPPRDISSPTFTDGSLTYSHVSEYSSEYVETLKLKVDHLESRLEKESENNSELTLKLRMLEKQLQEYKQKKANRSVKTAMI